MGDYRGMINALMGAYNMNMPMPTNMKAFAKYLNGDSSPIDERFFSKADINSLRQAYKNDRLGLERQNTLAHHDPFANFDNNKGYITYSDYNINPFGMAMDTPIQNESKASIVAKSLIPSYSMATTLGNAYYGTNDRGDVILKDRYDFDRNNTLGDGMLADLHRYGYNHGKPYDININLGNPRDWR